MLRGQGMVLNSRMARWKGMGGSGDAGGDGVGLRGKCDKCGLPITLQMDEGVDGSGSDDLGMFFRWTYGFYLSGCLLGLGAGVISAALFGLSVWIGLAIMCLTLGFMFLFGRWNSKHGVSRMVFEKVSRDRAVLDHDDGGDQEAEGAREIL